MFNYSSVQKNNLKLKNNLKYLLGRQKSSMTTIARKAGVNKSTLHGYLEGVIPKVIVTIESLALYFGVDPADLLYSDLEKTKESSVSSSEQKFEITIRSLGNENIIDVLQQKS